MRFESEWPGDAVAAPICGTDDQEDEFFESLGGRSWLWVDKRSNHVDAAPIAVVLQDWCETAINLAPASSALSSQRLQRAGVNAGTAPTDFSGWRALIILITSIIAELWSRMLRERESRRIRAAWETIDDRTLKDIGVSRYEIEYGRDARDWS
jgi:uncharacterized protein YjiS (DUF1127 family)